MQQGLPALVARYRRFLTSVLARDYTVRRALLRNTLALGSFTLGFVLTPAGLALSGVGPAVPGTGLGAAGLLVLVPGGLLLAVGLLGIALHALETVALGGRTSVKAGVGAGVLMSAVLGLIVLSGTPLEAATMGELLALPALVIVVGAAGALAFHGRTHLLLTDNRARLLTGALAFLFAIVGLFTLAPTGSEFFPTTDPNQIRITLDAPLGTNVEASNRIAEQAQARVEALLADHPAALANVKNVSVGVGVGGDAQFGGGAKRAETSRLTYNLVDYADRAEPSPETLQRLRDGVQGIPGVTIDFSQDENGPPTGPPVNIEISGPDFATIVRISQDLKQRLERGAQAGDLPGLVDITDDLDTGRPELRVNVDRERAAQFGLSTQPDRRHLCARPSTAPRPARTARATTSTTSPCACVASDRRRRSKASRASPSSATRGQRRCRSCRWPRWRRGPGFGSITRLDQAAGGDGAGRCRTRLQRTLRCWGQCVQQLTALTMQDDGAAQRLRARRTRARARIMQ